jgi:hypothetical protein
MPLRRWLVRSAAMLLAAAPLLAAAAADPVLPPLVVDLAGPGPGWRVVTLPTQQIPATRYGAERLAMPGGAERLALRIEAAASYGNLVHRPLPGPLPQRLRWSWRVSQANGAVDLRRKAGDDSPAKVCLSFDWPLERVPFMERQLLRLARSRSGEDLPAATLCWVWGGGEAQGSVIDNAYSRRVRVIVLHNAAEAGARWFDEDRDIAADLRLAFGDELPETAPLPALSAVIVAADGDNTGGRSLAFVAALRFASAGTP